MRPRPRIASRGFRAGRVVSQAARTGASAASQGGARPLLLGLLGGILLIAGPSAIAASEWKPFGLQGIQIRSLAAGPDVLCAGTQGMGVYCRDLGPSAATGWKALGPAGTTITWLWIDPTNTQTRFAAAGWAAPSLYRTLDGGRTWTPVDPGGGAWAVHGIPGTPRVWAAGWTIWVSEDRGLTWRVTSPDAGLDCLEVAPTNPAAVWSGGETMIFMGYTTRTLDGGLTWQWVWDSRTIGDNQTSDVSAHPVRDGLVLTGHEGFVLRTENHGLSFAEVLTAPARFFLDWDGANPDRAYAAGSPNGGTAHAFVSGDLGKRWTNVTGTVLAPRTVFRLEGDERRLGVVYAATDNGVYRYYGGGSAVCLDARAGWNALKFRPQPCTSIPGGGHDPEALPGDLIAFDVGALAQAPGRIDLGEVECVLDNADLTLQTLDTPDPAPGRALGLLARPVGASDYGASSSGLPRVPSSGGCP